MKKRVRQYNVFNKENRQFYHRWYDMYGGSAEDCSFSLCFNEECNSQYIPIL